MKAFRKILVFLVPLLVVGFVVSMLYKWNYIQHTQHIPDEFNIPNIGVGYDANKNRIDDSKDIIEGAKKYVARNPRYEELKEYDTGWPSQNRGQAGDVIAQALLNAGYDLSKLIYQDIQKNPDVYDNNPRGENIAFRVVDNQRIYFSRYGEPKDLDYHNINDWQTGDIVFFEKDHAAIVSDKVNDKGIRFVIHHFCEHQSGYLQDVLETDAWGKIVGHFRVSARTLSPKTDYSSITTEVKE